jgi:hypothetical protein
MSKLRTISAFKSALAGGGARPNLFEVSIPNFPFSIDWEDEDFSFLCKAANLPASNISPIDVPFRGRILKVAGDRVIDPWSVTVINDENFKLRTAFEQWANQISKLNNNTGATSPTSYMVDAYVNQLGRGASSGKESESNSNSSNGTTITPLRSYKFFDIFPTAISQIDLSYDSSDTIEEYTVEFQVQYWSAGEGNQNNNDQTNTTIE